MCIFLKESVFLVLYSPIFIFITGLRLNCIICIVWLQTLDFNKYVTEIIKYYILNQ